MAAATRARASSSSGSLRIRSCLVTVEAGTNPAAGSAAWSRSRKVLHSWSPAPSRPPVAPAAARVSTTSRTGSAVSGQAATSISSSPSWSRASGASRAGTTSRASPAAGTTSRVSRSRWGGW